MKKAVVGLSTLLVAIASLPLTPSVAEAGSKKSPQCVIGGANLNEIYGTDDGFVVDPFCTEIATGAKWRPILRWNVAGTWEFEPEGFDPAAATPLEDFLLKFEGARYVVDAGTRQEREHFFAAEDLLLQAADVPDGWDFATWTPRLAPLSRGTHTVDKYTIFSAVHCDGIPSADGGICAPAGEHLAESVQLVVR